MKQNTVQARSFLFILGDLPGFIFYNVLVYPGDQLPHSFERTGKLIVIELLPVLGHNPGGKFFEIRVPFRATASGDKAIAILLHHGNGAA